MRRPIIELLTLPLLFGPLGCPSSELDDAFEVRSGGVQTPGNPEFVCPLRWAGAPGDERALPYCATADLLDPQPEGIDWNSYTRIVVAQHGRGAGASAYLTSLTNAANYAENQGYISGDTFVIAPQFIATNDVNAKGLAWWQMEELLWWKADSGWPSASLSSGSEGVDPEYSSFTLIEQMVQHAVERMPKVREVVFTGQSAGGQFVQKFAVLNNLTFPDRRVTMRYRPANAYAYTYLTEERPIFEFAPYGYEFDTPNANQPHGWPDLELCDALAGEAIEDEYNDWEKGLDGLPVEFVGQYDEATYPKFLSTRYRKRDVTYLMSEVDILHHDQCSNGVQAQGRHRKERARAYMAHVNELGSNHHLAEVPDLGHGSALYGKDCVRRVLFGVAKDCGAIEDHNAGMTWAGEIIDIAVANIDDDPEQEVAVIHLVDGVTNVWILDDVFHGYEPLQHVTQGLSKQDRIIDIEFGNVIGDEAVELIVARASRKGSAWLAYENGEKGFGLATEGGHGRTPVAMAVNDLLGDTYAEIALAWDADAGERWAVFQNDGSDELVLISTGTWSGNSRPVDIDIGNVSGVFPRELVVGRDADSGDRIFIYDLLGNSVALGSDWPAGSRLVDVDVGNFDADSRDEIAVAVRGFGWRWRILDDESGSFAPLTSGGHTWLPNTQPTAIAIGRPAPYHRSLAIARSGPVATKVEVRTYDTDKTLGDIRRDGKHLGNDAAIRALLFANLDDHPEDELVFGRMGDLLPGFRFRVLAAP
jgi:hypothetical protein